jgi:hypothetical protein
MYVIKPDTCVRLLRIYEISYNALCHEGRLFLNRKKLDGVVRRLKKTLISLKNNK